MEDFFFNDNKGRISVIRIDKDKYEFLDVILEESFHLSFPFVFKEGESIYMIPESHENHDIRLYKCLDFPYNWKLEKILMSDINAADTMLIKENIHGLCLQIYAVLKLMIINPSSTFFILMNLNQVLGTIIVRQSSNI